MRSWTEAESMRLRCLSESSEETLITENAIESHKSKRVQRSVTDPVPF